ncbi:MAG: helix-turn-helix domain-containing protein [Halioglobus sp.]|nr:helix-turn-helix domain-containing protein [Halioglobus sp.]
MYDIVALLYPHALATSVTLPMEIMRAASQMASVGERGASQVRFRIAGSDRRQLQLSSGLVLKPDMGYEEIGPTDLLLLPAIWRNPLPTVNAMRAQLALLRRQAGSGGMICSVGSGSFLLAEAGLLDGRPATTHWNYFRPFSRRYPQVDLRTHHLITQSDNIFCVGSVNSIADLMVHIIEGWFGPRIARGIENQFSPEIRRSFQAAAYQNAADSAHRDEVVAQAQQLLQQHLATPLSMQELAGKLDLNPRSLHRRFKRATGVTPMAYLQSLRVASARELLRHSNLHVGDIAWQVGLQDVSYFSQLFKRLSGMSPLQYREAVRGKLFDPGTVAQS